MSLVVPLIHQTLGSNPVALCVTVDNVELLNFGHVWSLYIITVHLADKLQPANG